MIEYIDGLLLSYGVIVVFALMVTNGIISAPPSELTLALGGAWAAANGISSLEIIAAGVFGNISGAFVLYLMGKHWGVEWLEIKKEGFEKSHSPISKRISKLIPEPSRMHQYATLFLKSGWVWVGLLRCFPVVRSIVSFPAGMASMPVLKFFLISITGMFIWATTWVSLGVAFNHSWIEYKEEISLSLLVILLVVLAGLYLALKRMSINIINSRMPNNQVNKDAPR